MTFKFAKTTPVGDGVEVRYEDIGHIHRALLVDLGDRFTPTDSPVKGGRRGNADESGQDRLKVLPRVDRQMRGVTVRVEEHPPLTVSEEVGVFQHLLDDQGGIQRFDHSREKTSQVAKRLIDMLDRIQSSRSVQATGLGGIKLGRPTGRVRHQESLGRAVDFRDESQGLPVRCQKLEQTQHILSARGGSGNVLLN